LGVSAMVMYLAYGLFRRALPTLVDQVAIAPEALQRAVKGVPGVDDVRRVRSRRTGAGPTIDMVILVAPDLPTSEAHAIADAVEELLKQRFAAYDISIHIEPSR
jgi:divalent metal cation (Fe/Co/Zn/Cd) transporter